jgi:hypothetical protein
MTDTRKNYLSLKRDELGRWIPIYNKIAYFMYPQNFISDSELGPTYEKRKVKIESNNKKYLEGIDLNKDAYRKFLKRRMIWLEIRKEKIKV